MRRELHGMGSHGWAAACKHHITKYSAIVGWSGVKHDATGLQKRVLWSDESNFWWVSLCLTDAGRTLPAWLHCTNSKVWRRRNNGMVLFYASYLQWTEWNLNDLAYQDILDNAYIFMWTVWEGLFHSIMTVPQCAKQDLVGWVWGGWTWLGPLAHLISNPTGHFWDEMEWRLWARPSRPTSVLYLTNALLEEFARIPTDTLQNLMESLHRRMEHFEVAKGESIPY